MTEMKQFAKRLCNIVIGCANKAKNIRYCRKLLSVTFITFEFFLPLRQSTSKLYFWKRYFLDIKQRSVTQYYSVRRSLFKYSSAAGKRFYSSGGPEGIRWLKY
jgi:hypothetical protein